MKTLYFLINNHAINDRRVSSACDQDQIIIVLLMKLFVLSDKLKINIDMTCVDREHALEISVVTLTPPSTQKVMLAPLHSSGAHEMLRVKDNTEGDDYDRLFDKRVVSRLDVLL